MRTKAALKNSIISLFSQIFILILMFASRKVFIIFLDINYLGYESLFGNIFSLLSVTELGISSIISFHLYKELAENNENEICKLMTIYKYFYRVVGTVVTLFGIIACFFLPLIIEDPVDSWSYVQLVYCLQLFGVVAGYFLSYKRTILIADQKEYVCIKIDLYAKFIIQILQIATLALFKSFVLYLIIKIAGNILANILVAHRVKKAYPFLQNKCLLTKNDIAQRNIVADTKNLIIHKISQAVYGGTDNIIISAFCGIRMVALFGNYWLIKQGVVDLFAYKLLNPIQASIANMVYSKEPMEKQLKLFKMFDCVSFFLASYVAFGFLIFLQPAIILWVGAEYLLTDVFVFALVATIFCQLLLEIVYKYRTCFGDYKQDRGTMIMFAVVNIVISLIGVQLWGVAGVQIGSFVALLFFEFGKARFVVKEYFKISLSRFIFKTGALFFIFALQCTLGVLLTYNLPLNLIGFAIRFLVWLVLPCVICSAVYFKTESFKEMLHYISTVKNIFLSKLKKHSDI